MIGTQVGQYKILDRLGSGGMGEVYVAEDARLRRKVALKFLAREYTQDEKAIERFLNEAQAASALEHTNICTIFGVDQTEEGQYYISMAHYDGETLDAKIKRGDVDLQEAVDVITQIARGLEKAHAHGITHRDIKPSNIMITREGTVKILDFGLAKLEGSGGLTRTGSILGTVEYMSPEQAAGGDIDGRTDIWSLGVIIFELVYGMRPFQAPTPSQTLWQIVNEKPGWDKVRRETVPLDLERIIQKCIEKKPHRRYTNITEMLGDLRMFSNNLTSGTITMDRPILTSNILTRNVKPIIYGLGFLNLVLAGLLLWGWFGPKQEAEGLPPAENSPQASGPAEAIGERIVHRITNEGGLTVHPNWNPESSAVIYTSNKSGSIDLWYKPVEGGRATQVTSSEGIELQPAWSPDGRTIAYVADEDGLGIYIRPADGGLSHRISDFGDTPRWSPDGELIAFQSGGDIYTVSANGGEPQVVVRGTSTNPLMVWGPDGRKLVYWNRTRADVFIHSLDSGDAMPLQLVPSGQEISGLALNSQGNRLFFSRGPFGGHNNIYVIGLDLAGNTAVGRPRAITTAITNDIQVALSPDGTRLLFSVFDVERHLWSLARSASSGSVGTDPQRLTRAGGQNYYPAFSPDGTQLVWTSHQHGSGLLVAMDMAEGSTSKVTQDWSNQSREVGPSFAPNNASISYGSTSRGSYELWKIPAVGSVSLRLTETSSPQRDTLTAWSPSDDYIVFYSNRSGSWDIWRHDVENGGEPEQLTDWQTNELYPGWHPGGEVLAFVSDRNGNPDIWICEPDGSNPRPFVTGDATEAWCAWSPDGRWFYYITDRGGVFNVWRKPGDIRSFNPEDPGQQATSFRDLAFGMPESALYTRFAISSDRLVLPLETRQSDIYMIELTEEEIR